MDPVTNQAAFDQGTRIAPLFLGFSCFLYEQAREQNLDALVFCTREGVFFKAVFEVLFNRDSKRMEPMATRLIEASRLSTFAPSALKPDAVDFERLFSLYKRQSPKTLLTSLGLDPTHFGSIVSRFDIGMEEMFGQSSADPRLKGLLEDPEFLQPIRSHLETQRRATMGYLDQHIDEFERIGFIDIGWQGTIQDSLAILYPNKCITGLYLGRALQRNPVPANCTKTAYGPDRNHSREDLDLLDAVNVIEFVCLSNGGSASHYVRSNDSGFVVVMISNLEEDVHIERFALSFQAGVLEAAQSTNVENLLERHHSGQLRIEALTCWREMLKQPTPELVEAYFSLKSNEKFGYGSINDQSNVPPMTTVLAAPFSGFYRQQLIRYLTYSQWAEGMRMRKDLSHAVRLLNYLLMKSSVTYKKVNQGFRVWKAAKVSKNTDK